MQIQSEDITNFRSQQAYICCTTTYISQCFNKKKRSNFFFFLGASLGVIQSITGETYAQCLHKNLYLSASFIGQNFVELIVSNRKNSSVG